MLQQHLHQFGNEKYYDKWFLISLAHLCKLELELSIYHLCNTNHHGAYDGLKLDNLILQIMI
jgi:hypothetical protein